MIDLHDEMKLWVEEATDARVASATRHHAGASRMAWSLELDRSGVSEPLFLLKDKGEGGGSLRDAAVLNALAETPIPVPRVLGLSNSPAMILLERLPGRSDFPAVDHEEEREPTARHLMELTARLHELDTAELAISHLSLPGSPGENTRKTLAQIKGAVAALGDNADPFFSFAIDWLVGNTPDEEARPSLIHSDMGPGNFLYERGRVTGIVDWEVAHFGDPMEDLAAIAVRDMATPVGDLSRRFSEYEAASGRAVGLARVNYFRALILVRNSLMIGLGLAYPPEGFNVEEMTMYQTLLMRAGALVLCDLLGVERPEHAEGVGLRSRESDGAAGARPLAARDAAPFFARRMLGLAEERRALMGDMIDRFPQRMPQP